MTSQGLNLLTVGKKEDKAICQKEAIGIFSLSDTLKFYNHSSEPNTAFINISLMNL